MRMTSKTANKTGFLARLRRDERGNTLAIVAGALVPLIGIIGGGVDISRAYLVKARLQQACDAGVLAGRKAVGKGKFDTAAQQQAKRFFDANFETGLQQSTGLAFTPTSPDNGRTVKGQASATLPTILMHIFGKKAMSLAVSCEASYDISSVDITLVLDTTGSMNESIPRGGGGYTSKISALRNAAEGFYDTMSSATYGTSRIRYAFVPYSSSVNVGKLIYAENPAYLDKNASYESRVPIYRRWIFGTYFDGWNHKRVTFDGTTNTDLSEYIKGNPLVLQSDQNYYSSYRWNGCIEELDTVASGNVQYNGTSITPSGLNDLNIDIKPSSSANGWKPQFPEIVYYRSNLNGTEYSDYDSSRQRLSSACPVEARLLRTYPNRTEFVGYLNSLNPAGNTYHDVGMIWGARLSSEKGIFASNVTLDPGNNSSISRHIVFMTDGDMVPSQRYYSAYGVEPLSRRITSDGGSNYSEFVRRHQQRFIAVCNAAKAKGIRVWVIAFATNLDSSMTDCASPNSSFLSLNGDELNNAFVSIAQSISDLRLTQ